MARFETTGQVLGLFLGAAVVAVLCIVFLTAEAHKRDMVEDKDEVRVGEKGMLERLQGTVQSLRNFFGNNQEEVDVKRYKRDTGDDMLNDFVFGDRRELKRKNEEKEPERDVTTQKVDNSLQKENMSKKDVLPDINEALLREASSHHKIRHIQEKIAHLSPNHQLVTAVLDKFCIISPCPITTCPVCPATNCIQCVVNNNSSDSSNNINNKISSNSNIGSTITNDNTNSTNANSSSNNINSIISSNNNFSSTISNDNTNSTGIKKSSNKTNGCPATTCPTAHIKHQFPHMHIHQHQQFRQEPIPGSPIVCSTNIEVIVIILLTSFTNLIIFTIFFFCLKARENFREELMSDEEEDAEEEQQTGEEYNGKQYFSTEHRRYSFSDIGYNQSPQYTVLEEYGFVV